MIKDNTNAWLIALLALLVLGCVAMAAMSGAISAGLPTHLAEGDVQRQVGPALTATAGYYANERMAVENDSATANLARANARAERVQIWRIGAGITFWGGLIVVLIAGTFGGSTWWAVHVWRQVQEARTMPLVRELGHGLKIVYPALNQRGHPMIVDTVTGGSWPLYDMQAVQEARLRYVERLAVVDRLAVGAEKIAKSTGNPKPGDWLHQIAEYSKVEAHQ